MEITVKRANPVKQRSACAVVGIYQNKKLSTAASEINKASGGAIAKVLRQGDISGAVGSSLVLHGLQGVAADRVLLIGYGKEKQTSASKYRKATTAAMTALNETGAKDAMLFLNELPVIAQDISWCSRTCVLLAEDNQYRYDEHKQNKTKANIKLGKLVIAQLSPDGLTKSKKAADQGQAIANGMALMKDLANSPANHCTPTDLANKAKALGRKFNKLTVKVLEEAAMKRLGMGSLLSVSRGSIEPAKLITLEYKGSRKKSAKPIVLVGKGVTFDTGGISLKPGAAMDEMKYDMCGAASVLGTLQTVAELNLPINVVGIIPATENMPGSKATKPGDIVTSMSGQTIEILNTDAEGRLILCDALTYAARFDPDTVIDIATLTGACVVALGKFNSGLLGNHQPLADDLLSAGRDSGDECWQLPISEEYNQMLSSNFADMANIGGGREGGTITAACFLNRFTKDYRWAHLDIAGTAWISGTKKGATGRPVPLLMQYLLNRC